MDTAAIKIRRIGNRKKWTSLDSEVIPLIVKKTPTWANNVEIAPEATEHGNRPMECRGPMEDTSAKYGYETRQTVRKARSDISLGGCCRAGGKA
eukprot:scaffold552681_cov22-Prasinocladus_malaysianus.AAC.1